ncbi:MAG: TlpA family protein disulfide reductase [Synergistaceae bacterium]|jgi:thiol-disulfide isomerase/thioredoxin|nr:TlpA family protein disulfide reductase [Synergistaceae bacterium]
MKDKRKIIIILSGLAIAAAVFIFAGKDAEKVFPAFASKSLEGQDVTDALFAEKKLTMVNIWTTWCPPCIGEMPDLGNLAKTMPEGSQLVGIILDADEPGALDDALKILEDANASFVQILPADSMGPVLSMVEAIPTTIFVDSAGNIVGNPLVGARPENAYRAEIDKLLKSLQ